MISLALHIVSHLIFNRKLVALVLRVGAAPASKNWWWWWSVWYIFLWIEVSVFTFWIVRSESVHTVTCSIFTWRTEGLKLVAVYRNVNSCGSGGELMNVNHEWGSYLTLWCPNYFPKWRKLFFCYSSHERWWIRHSNKFF